MSSYNTSTLIVSVITFYTNSLYLYLLLQGKIHLTESIMARRESSIELSGFPYRFNLYYICEKFDGALYVEYALMSNCPRELYGLLWDETRGVWLKMAIPVTVHPPPPQYDDTAWHLCHLVYELKLKLKKWIYGLFRT